MKLLILLLALQVPCKGITKKGEPCKSTFVNKQTGYCRQHDPKAIHCLKPGCGNIVKEQNTYCKWHKK